MLKNLRPAAIGPVKSRLYRFNFVDMLQALEGSIWHKYLSTEEKVKTNLFRILMYMDKAEIQLTKTKNLGAIDRQRIQTAAAVPNQFATVQSMAFIKLSVRTGTNLSYENCRLSFELGTEKLPFSVDIHAVEVFMHENKIENYGVSFYHWVGTPGKLRHELEKVTIS